MKKISGRREIAKVIFDLAKYLLTAVAISSVFSEKVRLISAFVASVVGLCLLYVGYLMMPEEKE